MERTKWIERKFSFDFPAGLLPNIIGRLQGTEWRLKAMTNELSEPDATKKPSGKWSIKEQIGHLVDLEDLHISRLKELKERKTELTAADMANKKTEDANHNARAVNGLITDFVTKRKTLIDLLQAMDDDTLLFKSLHPRLNIYMRPVDVAYFTAEHDDHHLASINELLIA